jgi:hypothetical protein
LLIWQPALRAAFSFNFGSYLKTKVEPHLFVDNQMVELENEVTQYESPNEGSRNEGSSNLYESPSLSTSMRVEVSYVAPQAHGIVNVALHREYSPGIVLYFPKGGRISILSKTNTESNYNEYY